MILLNTLIGFIKISKIKFIKKKKEKNISFLYCCKNNIQKYINYNLKFNFLDNKIHFFEVFFNFFYKTTINKILNCGTDIAVYLEKQKI